MWKPSIDYDAPFFKSRSQWLSADNLESPGLVLRELGTQEGLSTIQSARGSRATVDSVRGQSLSGTVGFSLARWDAVRLYIRRVSMMAAAMAITTMPGDWARHPDKQPPASISPVPSRPPARTTPYSRDTPQSIWCHMRMGQCSTGFFSLDDVIRERRAF